MMKLRDVFTQVNEIVYGETDRYKKDVLSDTKFMGLTINLLLYMETVFSLEEPTLKNVAKSLNVTNASASIAVQKLINGGFLVKEQSDGDRRVYHLHATKKGRALMKEEKAAMNAFWESFFDKLNEDEQERLAQMLTKFIQPQKRNTA